MQLPPTNQKAKRKPAKTDCSAAVVRVTAQELARRQRISAGLKQAGISVAAWAKAHQFNHQIVQGVLSGRFVGAHGEAHAVCVALKLKQGSAMSPAEFDPAAALGEAA